MIVKVDVVLVAAIQISLFCFTFAHQNHCSVLLLRLALETIRLREIGTNCVWMVLTRD